MPRIEISSVLQEVVVSYAVDIDGCREKKWQLKHTNVLRDGGDRGCGSRGACVPGNTYGLGLIDITTGTQGKTHPWD